MYPTVKSERQLLCRFVASIACAVVEYGGRSEYIVDGWHDDDFSRALITITKILILILLLD